MQSNYSRPDITNPAVDAYLVKHVPMRDAVLSRMEKHAAAEHIPIVGPVVGNFLYVLAKSILAKTLLEVGTAIGYSTIWWAKAVERFDGLVTSIELNESRYKQAQKNIEAAGLSNYVKLELGEATKVLPKKIGSSFDIAFIDTDKDIYLQVLSECKRKVRKGGLIIADNCLWSGLVATDDDSEATRIIKQYNDSMLNDKEYDFTIVPMRDGVSIALKK
jgi:predicted O-methyltransferase YrrM